jgi:predicted permease
MHAVLLRVLALGFSAGALRWFPSPPAAIAALNRFALMLAFPALIVSGLASDSLALPAGPGFYLVHGLAASGQVLAALALTRVHEALRRGRGAIAMAALFGNIAYLGIPFATAVLGPRASGLASLAAALHIVIAMTIGPLLLLRHSGAGPRPLGSILATVARQPLVWAPLVGLALRAAPLAPRSLLVDLITPLGASAGPVALFMLGLYLHANRGRLRRVGAEVAATCLLKLLVYPALALVSAAVLAAFAPLLPLERQVVVLVAAMPVAITTFSLAEEFGTGREVVASSIVASTLLALVTLPVLAAALT